MYDSVIRPDFVGTAAVQHYAAGTFPSIHPVHWLHSHFAVGGWSPLRRLSGMLTAHMTRIAPRNGFTWHPHRGLEIYTWVLDGRLYHEDTTGGKGEIGAGELQRMFSGDWIEHQELNLTDEPTRVIQIWYAAEPRYQGLKPHYQQARAEELPNQQVGEARVYNLIGEGSPMAQHMVGRLTATSVPAGGTTTLALPRPGEELFLYVTDGRGAARYDGEKRRLGQNDVMLARPEAGEVRIRAEAEEGLDYLSFYLPAFMEAG